jgi:hypothetical protein
MPTTPHDDFDFEPDRSRLSAAYLDRVLPDHVKARIGEVENLRWFWGSRFLRLVQRPGRWFRRK